MSKLLTNLIKSRASCYITASSFKFQKSFQSTFRNDPGLIEPNYKKFSYAHSTTGDLHLLSDTIGERLDALSRQKPNEVGYKFCMTQTALKFGELKQRVDEIAQNLLNMGFKKGDRLAIMLPNIPETVLSILAAGQIGVIAVIMNPAYQLVEIEYMLKKTQAKGLIFLDNLKVLQHYEIMKKLCPELETSSKGELNSKNLPHLKHLIVVNNKLIKDTTEFKGTWSWEEDIQKYKHSNKHVLPRVDFDDTLAILFTSGTTGFPKGAMLSHYNLMNTAYLDIYGHGIPDSSKVIGCPIPLFHSFGLIGGVIEPLINGARGVFPAFFPDTNALLKAIHSEKCTALKGAPVIFLDLLNHPDRKKYDLSSLEYLLIGASTVPRPLLIKMKEELKLKYILTGLGLTESSAAGLCTRKEDALNNPKYAYESIGIPFYFVESKIIDKEGNLAPVNTDGEICLRGYNVFQGYWDEPAKTAETIDKNGWLRTGDIGSMDENGCVFFKSREKEIIIRGGVNIYPAEIEAFMRSHPDVFDCYAFGLPDERVGEEVAIWIKLKPNTQNNVTAESITEFCKGKIAFFKTPKYIKFVDSFPINPNGKVQKFKMVEQMKKEINK